MTKQKWKLTPAAFRRGVHWMLLVAAIHLAGRLLYGVLFSNTVKILWNKDENYTGANGVVLVFQLVFWLLVALIYIWRWQMSYADVQREMKNAAKEESFNPNRYFLNTFFRDWIWRTVLYAVFQIPFLIRKVWIHSVLGPYYTTYGLNLGGMTGVEKFYIADAGLYGIFNFPILGFLLTTVYFFAIMVAVHYVVYRVMLYKQNKF